MSVKETQNTKKTHTYAKRICHENVKNRNVYVLYIYYTRSMPNCQSIIIDGLAFSNAFRIIKLFLKW